jgi:hypothetical protein
MEQLPKKSRTEQPEISSAGVFCPLEIRKVLLDLRHDMMFQDALIVWKKEHSSRFEHVLAELLKKTQKIVQHKIWNMATVEAERRKYRITIQYAWYPDEPSWQIEGDYDDKQNYYQILHYSYIHALEPLVKQLLGEKIKVDWNLAFKPFAEWDQQTADAVKSLPKVGEVLTHYYRIWQANNAWRREIKSL